MSKYTYYNEAGDIVSIKLLKDDDEAVLNIHRAYGFIKGSYPAHVYRIEDGKPVLIDLRRGT